MSLSSVDTLPCRNCGGELELKAVIAGTAGIPETRYFQCKNCDRIDVLEYAPSDANYLDNASPAVNARFRE